MNSSHLLQLWLDGDLDIANEQQLFAELASDSSLREEMHDLLALREVVAMDHSAHVPSEAATRNVFERLGFTPPAAEPIGWFGKYRQGILSSTTTAAIMLLLFLWDPMGWGSDGQFTTQPMLAGGSATELVQEDMSLAQNEAANTQANTQLDAMSEYQVGGNNTNAPNHNNISELAIASIGQNETTTPEIHTSVDNSTVASEELILQTPSFATEPVVAAAQEDIRPAGLSIALQESQNAPLAGFSHSGSITRDRVAPVYGATGFDNPLQNGAGSELLDVRHTSSMPLISTRVSAESNSLNGFSAIYWRARSHKFWFGLAAGQEAMYQEYGHKRDDGRMVSMAQYPSVFWYGAAARYYFNSTVAETPLYSEMILAANRFGPMSRLSVGAQWSPYANLTLQAGIDGQLSFYNHQQRLYTTPSLGLSYGVVFKF